MRREHLEALAAQLVGRPVYVLLSSDGAEFGTEHVGGLYSRRLDMLAQSFLQEAGRWQGRRPAIYIDDQRGELNDMEVHATLIHELSHVADLKFDETPEQEVSAAGMNLARLVHWQGIETPIVPVEFDEHHSARFVRAAIHLWRRAQAIGSWCPPDWLWTGALYGAPDPITVIESLGNEPERLEKLPVSLVVDLPAPPAFDELFARIET